MRVATGDDFDLEVVFVDSNGDPTDADSTPTVTVTDELGVAVATGAVTTVVGSPGVYRAKVESRSEVGRLDVVWNGLVATYNQRHKDVVFVDGGYLFEIRELRAMPAMQDRTTYPYEALKVARDMITEFVNDYCQLAFVETYAEETVDGDRTNTFLATYAMPKRVLSASVAGVAQDTSEWTIAQDGRIRAATTWTSYRAQGQGVVVRYTYGMRTVPADLKKAALLLAQNWLTSVQSSIPDRARMMTTTWGTFQLTTAGTEYPTGYPEIDSVLNRYTFRQIPAFG